MKCLYSFNPNEDVITVKDTSASQGNVPVLGMEVQGVLGAIKNTEGLVQVYIKKIELMVQNM